MNQDMNNGENQVPTPEMSATPNMGVQNPGVGT